MRILTERKRNKNRESKNPLHTDDIIYTPGIVVFRDDNTDELFSENCRFKVDVITCAAPNLRKNPSNTFNPDILWSL